MDMSVNVYDDMTLSALLCYFVTQEIHISIDMIHLNVALLSSNHTLHTSSSTSPIITPENSIDELYITIQDSCHVTNCINSNRSN